MATGRLEALPRSSAIHVSPSMYSITMNTRPPASQLRQSRGTTRMTSIPTANHPPGRGSKSEAMRSLVNGSCMAPDFTPRQGEQATCQRRTERRR
jgi:hypothetical protein